MNVVLDHVEKLNDHTNTFWMSSPRPVDYIAGQYIEMYLPHSPADERGQKHWFTLSSSPTEPLISITTKFATPSSTFKVALSKLKPGNTIHISEPMGDFVLPKDVHRPIVYVVAGIGVTPVRSMVKWLVDTKESRSVQVIYAAKTNSDLVFQKLIEDYAETVDYIISDAVVGKPAQAGKKLDTDFILKTVKDINKNPLIYVSGPEPLVETLTKDLSKHVAANDIISDYFPGYTSVWVAA